MPSKRSFTLVLGGGNALGAYHRGACRQLLLGGMLPDRIVGASIGAVTGAILLGNPPEQRLERLAAFWEQAASPVAPLPGGWKEARARQVFWSGLDALMTGRPGLFRGALPRLPALAVLPHRSLNDHRPRALASRQGFGSVVGEREEVDGDAEHLLRAVELESAIDRQVVGEARVAEQPGLDLDRRVERWKGSGCKQVLGREFAAPGPHSILRAVARRARLLAPRMRRDTPGAVPAGYRAGSPR
jgi:Patatin-like phospholipase